jgi:hypothetical protein
MLFPATLSVVLASRGLLALFWNLSWYLVMSWFGQQVFGPAGVWIGGFFALAYVYKAMKSPVPSVQFRVQHFSSTKKRPVRPERPIDEENVIDVEYRHIDSGSHKLNENRDSSREID